jgi:thymidylate synthase
MSKNIEEQYLKLLKDILENGVEKQDRTGTGTISVFGRQIRHNMSEGFPLLTTKRMPLKIIATELKWFLKGDTNIKFLVDKDCHIWDGDAYQAYLKNRDSQYIGPYYTKDEFIEKIKTDDKFAKKWGELGPIYGKQWVNWGSKSKSIRINGACDFPVSQNQEVGGINQIQNLIEQLKTNPDSRRLMVNAWNVSELNKMTLPPCHYGFQVYTRELSMEERMDYALSKNDFRFTDAIINEEDYEKYNIPTRAISLMWNQRSVDTFLGLPFNIASYGLLLEIIAKEVNMVPDELIGNLGDTHLYTNHIDQAKEQLSRQPTGLPKLHIENVNILKGEFETDVHGYDHHKTIKAPLNN